MCPRPVPLTPGMDMCPMPAQAASPTPWKQGLAQRGHPSSQTGQAVSANAPRKEALFFSGVSEWINYAPTPTPPHAAGGH